MKLLYPKILVKAKASSALLSWMRKAFMALLLCIPLQGFSQLLPQVVDYKGENIKEIRETGYHFIPVKNGWVSYIFFSEKGWPVEKVSWNHHERRAHVLYSYRETDTLFSTTYVDTVRRYGSSYQENRIIFNHQHQIIRVEQYRRPEAETPAWYDTDILRDSLQRIISFTRILPSEERHNAGDLLSWYRLYYSGGGQVDSVTISDSEDISHISIYYAYNRKGQISDVITDHNNSSVVLGGVMPWSKNDMDRYKYRYTYDRQGNWTKRYFVTRGGKHIDAKRKISYR